MNEAPLIGISSGFTDYGDYLGVAFSRPLEARGAVAVILPLSASPEAVLDRIDGLLLAVGRDLEPRRYGGMPHSASTLHSPLRDEAELALAPAAIAAGVPVLGICRGMQVISIALGGTLHPDHSVLPGAAAEHPGGDWPALGAQATVNSYHHQSVDRLGAGVNVTARAADGVIEAIEVPAAREMCVGVQWELQEEPDSPVFDLLVDHARRARGRRPVRPCR